MRLSRLWMLLIALFAIGMIAAACSSDDDDDDGAAAVSSGDTLKTVNRRQGRTGPG